MAGVEAGAKLSEMYEANFNPVILTVAPQIEAVE